MGFVVRPKMSVRKKKMIDSEKLPKEFIYMDDFSGEYSLATACLTGEYIPANQGSDQGPAGFLVVM